MNEDRNVRAYPISYPPTRHPVLDPRKALLSFHKLPVESLDAFPFSQGQLLAGIVLDHDERLQEIQVNG